MSFGESILNIESEAAEGSRNIEPRSETLMSNLEQSIVEIREVLEKYPSTSNQPHICKYCDAQLSNINEYQSTLIVSTMQINGEIATAVPKKFPRNMSNRIAWIV